MGRRTRKPGQLDAELDVLRRLAVVRRLASASPRKQQALLQELVRVGEWMPQVKREARRWSSASLPMEDLVQAGLMGLLEAAQRFDPQRPAGPPEDPRPGWGWVNYAYAWVRLRISEAGRQGESIVAVKAGALRMPRGWVPLEASDAEDGAVKRQGELLRALGEVEAQREVRQEEIDQEIEALRLLAQAPKQLNLF